MARTATGVLFECILITAFAVLLLEGASRVLHWGVRPMLPSTLDDAFAPRMPARFDSWISVYGGPKFRVCTDQFGLRKSSCEGEEVPAKVVVVGDSQAFGWGMPYSDSFSVKVARSLGTGEETARSMAAGGADIEGLYGWARDYRSKGGPQAAVNIVVVNLGNDLDEMYFGRSSHPTMLLKSLRSWLTVHSYLMLDITLLKYKLLGVGEWYLPPGANPVVFSLNSQERSQLASGTAAAAVRLLRALPPAQHSVVLLMPQDYQVARSEFAKYQRFYPSTAQFEGWSKRISEAASRLDDIERSIAQDLHSQGIVVVRPKGRLATHDPLAVIDRNSHHYTALGQGLIAAAIVEALQKGAVPPAQGDLVHGLPVTVGFGTGHQSVPPGEGK